MTVIVTRGPDGKPRVLWGANAGELPPEGNLGGLSEEEILTLISGAAQGNLIDQAPEEPNVMDDEFNGTELDDKWTPLYRVETDVVEVRNSRLVLEAAAGNAGRTILALVQDVPSGNWKAQAQFTIESLSWSFFGLGLIARNSVNGKATWAGLMAHTSLGMYTGYVQGLNGSVVDGQVDLANFQGQKGYFQLEYDLFTETLTWGISVSGTKFRKMWSCTLANFGGSIDQLGIVTHNADTGAAGWGGLATFDWFRVTDEEVTPGAYFPNTVAGKYSNSDNVQSLDATFASISGAANVTASLSGSDFDFSDIPDTDIVTSLTINVRENADVYGYMWRHIDVLKDGVLVHQNNSGVMGSGFGTRIISFVSDGDWTVEDLKTGLLSINVVTNGHVTGAGYVHRIDALYVEVEHAPFEPL